MAGKVYVYKCGKRLDPKVKPKAKNKDTKKKGYDEPGVDNGTSEK